MAPFGVTNNQIIWFRNSRWLLAPAGNPLMAARKGLSVELVDRSHGGSGHEALE